MAILVTTAAVALDAAPAAAAPTSAQFRTVGGGIDCAGTPAGDGGTATPATVTLTRTDDTLQIGLDLGGLPGQTYSVEVFEATGNCGSDDAAAIGSAAGGATSSLSLSLPHATLGGESLGNGAGSERVVVVLDRNGSTCGCGDVYVAALAMPDLEQEPPQARFTVSAEPGNRTVTFDASASTPADAIVRYDWDFDGDGTIDLAGPAPTVTHTYARAGHFAVDLIITDDQQRVSAATQTAVVVDTFRVELKSWIPHANVADPFVLAPTRLPNLLIPLLGAPLRSCFESVADTSPTGYVEVLGSSFAGDNHQGIGITGGANDNPVAADARITTAADFQWDGQRVSGLVSHTGSGATVRSMSIRGPRGSATCRQSGHADRSVNPGARTTGGSVVTVGVKGSDPLTPPDLATAARQTAERVCQVARANWQVLAVDAACAGALVVQERIPAVPITPSLDGEVSVTLSDGEPVVAFKSDLFPSYGVSVTRNSAHVGTAVYTDAACIPATGYAGAANVLVGLQTLVGRQHTGTLPPYGDRPCQPLPPDQTYLAAQLLPVVNPLTEVATIIMVSNVTPS